MKSLVLLLSATIVLGAPQGLNNIQFDSNGSKRNVIRSVNADTNFQSLTHNSFEKNGPVFVRSFFTPEVDQQNLQATFRTSFPEVEQYEFPPAYVRHVPSPVQRQVTVPIIDVAPPQKVLIHNSFERLHGHPRKVVVGTNVPIYPQLGTLIVHHPVVKFEKPLEHFKTNQNNELLAGDIHLVGGFTPEVAEATRNHLAHVAAARATVPKLSQEF